MKYLFKMAGQPEKTEQPDGYNCQTGLPTGFRAMYCSVRKVISLSKLQNLSGLTVFLPGGPHVDEMNFGSETTFGRYNPEFLDWLETRLIPDGPDSPMINRVSRAIYDVQLGPVVRPLYRTHRVLYSDPDRYQQFLKAYNAAEAHEATVRPYTEKFWGKESRVSAALARRLPPTSGSPEVSP